jgi:hypothetical protein
MLHFVLPLAVLGAGASASASASASDAEASDAEHTESQFGAISAPPPAAALAVGTREHLLLWGDPALTASTTLVARTHPPRKTGIMAVVPDKPWEFLIFAYTAALKVSDSDYRIYYDAFGSHQSGGNRFFCVATSTDGTVYTKPQLGLVPFENSTQNNIVGVVGLGPDPLAVLAGTVFIDENPRTPASERFKLVNHNAYGSADGFTWRLLSANHIPFSDTLTAVFYDAESDNYSIYCRTHDPGAYGPLGCPSGRAPERSIGLLQTKNLSAASWGAGDQTERLVEPVFKVDNKDPPCLDIYTSAAVRVADATFIFPQQYLHCNTGRSVPSSGGGLLNKGCAHRSGGVCPKPAAPLPCNSNAECNRTTVCANGTLLTHPSCLGVALTCLPSKRCGAAGQVLCVEKLPDVVLPVSAPVPCVQVPRLNDGLLDVGFAASRDGRSFERFDRQPFLPRGPGKPRTGCAAEQGRAGAVCSGVWEGSFDAGSTNMAVGIMDRGTEETIMIGEGHQYTHGGYVNFSEPGGPVLSGVQILTMRRHGFVSLRPKGGNTNGILLTRPLKLPKCKAASERLILELNLHTAMTGSAIVELLPEDTTLEASKALRSIVLVGNSAHLPVQFTPFARDWEADAALPPSAQGMIARLSFKLVGNADLYGFQFLCDSATSPSADLVPAWTAPPFNSSGHINATVAYGMPVVQHTAAVKIYNATSEWTNAAVANGSFFGVYSHAAMIGFFDGYFVASWKSAALQHDISGRGHPPSEDTPGQRILWSYATAEAPLKYSAPTILFPNMSSGDEVCHKWTKGANPRSTYLSLGCARLFAEPTVVLNGHVYVAASLRQFCLWPLDPVNDDGIYLLLRRITLSHGVPPKLGEIFWAKYPGDAWAATNARLEIQTLSQMDAETKSDVASLLDGERPCEANATKCEYCAGGCQDLRATVVKDVECIAEDVGGPWIERTHWTVPSNAKGNGTDILVYRASRSVFCWSQRHQGGDWSALSKTRLPEIHSNMNAGTLPDGRVYLLHNPVNGKSERDPLVVSLSSDGYSFDKAYVALSCHLPPVNKPGHAKGGCKRRNPGGDGSPGPQYPQGLVHGDNLYVIMSMNKEDIWVEQIPLSSL